MAKSMTGYGRSELGWNGRKFTVEIKSVNNRYLDINIRMPRQFNPFEAQLRALLKDYITRGKVDVYISFEDLSGESVCVTYNRALAGQYLTRAGLSSSEQYDSGQTFDLSRRFHGAGSGTG